MKRITTILLTIIMAQTLQAGKPAGVMTPETMWKLGRVSLQAVSDDGQTIIYGVTRYDVTANKGTSQLFCVTMSGATSQLTDGDKSASAVGFTRQGRIAYMQDGQLWTMARDGSGKKQASNIEGGISNVKISPKGDAVLFTRDVKYRETTAEMYPSLPKANAIIVEDLMYRHWNQWEDDMVSHVFYAPFDGEKISGSGTDIMPSEPYDSPLSPMGGAEQLAWSPDGIKIAYTCKKKTGAQAAVSTDADIYIYDIVSKQTQNLTEGNKGYDMNPAWSPDGRFIAWTSMEEDGYEADKNDIKLYEWSTGKTYNLTSRWDETIEEFAWERTSDKIIFRTTLNAVEQLFEYRLPKTLAAIDPHTSIVQLTKGDDCKGAFILTPKFIIAERYDFNRPNEIVAYDMKKRTFRYLTDVNGDIFKNIKPAVVKKRLVPTTDGKQMLVWELLPPDFDASKKYPALLFCGGGPQNAITPSYSFRWNFQLMASNGYVVIVPNRRGLPSFGVRWNEEISGQWGGQAITDLMTASDAIAAEPYVDETRMGAVGASYGGYSVYMLAGKHQGRYKAFISHCGTFDNRSWYGTTEEIFFANKDLDGPYWKDYRAPSYNEFSPSSYVEKWDTPILIIQGQQDFRVPENQSMQAFQAARLRGIESRMVLFPDECHWVLKPQNSLLWHAEFYGWLDKYLKK